MHRCTRPDSLGRVGRGLKRLVAELSRDAQREFLRGVKVLRHGVHHFTSGGRKSEPRRLWASLSALGTPVESRVLLDHVSGFSPQLLSLGPSLTMSSVCACSIRQMSCRFGSAVRRRDIIGNLSQSLTFENLAQHTQKDSPGLAGSHNFSKRPVMSFFGFSEQVFWGVRVY